MFVGTGSGTVRFARCEKALFVPIRKMHHAFFQAVTVPAECFGVPIRICDEEFAVKLLSWLALERAVGPIQRPLSSI